MGDGHLCNRIIDGPDPVGKNRQKHSRQHKNAEQKPPAKGHAKACKHMQQAVRRSELGIGLHGMQPEGQNEQYPAKKGCDMVRGRRCCGKNDGDEEILGPSKHQPAIHVGKPVQENAERKDGRQLAEEVDRFCDRRRKHQNNCCKSGRTRRNPKQRKSIDPNRQQKHANQLHNDKCAAYRQDMHQARNRHVRAGRI